MNEDIKFLIFTIISTVLCFVVWQIPRQIRSRRLKKVAETRGLNFNRNYKLLYPDKIYNEILGTINGHNVRIYDSVSRKNFNPEVGSGIYSYRTILQIDGVQTQSKEGSFTNISYIESELKKLII
jgi:hypothetical protein